ncbi:baseplate J/gp47 family protein [Kaistia nematophila]|uniref:Baseplate J/gp47 family protein n=1 Tax=Kaistia nematophila TaxID=2994654 RepID=A0A9X3E8K2_9HYPH|nr:baseplate J/gp47 family protein [Kaistia nematophila]MCX5571483.1 baseplate J/gp47 family protein [Kaistia nematophila]
MTTIDLAAFPPPEAIETLDFEAILAAVMADAQARFEAAGIAYDVGALETDPVKIVAEAASYRELLLRARVNDAIRANLLAFARGADLDHLAAFYDAARLPEEGDDRFRLRTQLIIQGRSTGGTEPRYRAVALGASLRVADAAVYRVGTSPLIQIAVIAADNNGVADAGLLALVAAAVNAPAVRMVNDTIEVVAAVTDTIDVSARIWLLPDASAALLEALVPALRAEWVAEGGLGFDLTREWLLARLMKTGVQRVEVTAPVANVIVPPGRAVALGAVNLTLMGRDR